MNTLLKWPKTAQQGKYSSLKANFILATLYRLEKRISERFPDSGLRQVANELLNVASQTTGLVQRLSRPNWWLRSLAFLAISLVIAMVVTLASLSLRLAPGADGWVEWIQAIESVINELIFLALALFFLFSIEIRVKRRIALKALHRLRSIAHVIDMHQLTKDPAYILAEAHPTASSPERAMTAFQLSRYLDYCSEMLSLTSKMSALFVQHLDDPVILAAVNDLETLSDGLSSKIWQKIMILQQRENALLLTEEE